MKKLIDSIEDFFYQKFVKSILFAGRLGRKSMMGYANLGTNFDYIYRNVPVGYNRIGKFVDKFLFSLPSLKATRNRKNTLSKILQNEIKNNVLLGKKTRIVDLASGTARYLVEIIENGNKDYVEGICIDRDKGSIHLGRKIAENKPIRYTKADVFKLTPLIRLSKKMAWAPNIIMASGLFIYLKDEEVKKVLSEIYNYLDGGGLVLFTSQVNNPSKKMMEKIGTTRENKPWALIYRDPELLRRWMLEIGYKSVIISVDHWGMYAFCTGRK